MDRAFDYESKGWEFESLTGCHFLERGISMPTIEENKKLIEKYTFLLPRNIFSGEVDNSYDYSYTIMDGMPKGWRIAFGDAMLEELAAALGSYVNNYQITDVKEKYGGLRWYDNGAPVHCGHYEIINKYENISYYTCIECGSAATCMTTGWISPYCDSCIKNIDSPFINIDEFYKSK